MGAPLSSGITLHLPNQTGPRKEFSDRSLRKVLTLICCLSGNFMRFCLPILMRAEKCSQQSGDERTETERQGSTHKLAVAGGKSEKSPGGKPGQSKPNERAENLCKTQKKQNKPGAAGKGTKGHTHNARTMSEMKVRICSRGGS